jgi:hypothetical protein
MQESAVGNPQTNRSVESRTLSLYQLVIMFEVETATIGTIQMQAEPLSDSVTRGMESPPRSNDVPPSDASLSASKLSESVKLNHTEPWERSLSRMLLQAATMPMSNMHHSCANAAAGAVTNRQQPISAECLILLGRSESRDYALEIEGSPSCSNPTSTYSSRNPSPARTRSIYRSPPPGSQSLLDSSSCSFEEDVEHDDDGEGESVAHMDSFSYRSPRRSTSLGTFSRSCSYATMSGTAYTDHHQQEIEARGEKEEVSDRDRNKTSLRSAAMSVHGGRSFPIRKARALREDDDPMDWLQELSERDTSRLSVPDLRLPLL